MAILVVVGHWVNSDPDGWSVVVHAWFGCRVLTVRMNAPSSSTSTILVVNGTQGSSNDSAWVSASSMVSALIA